MLICSRLCRTIWMNGFRRLGKYVDVFVFHFKTVFYSTVAVKRTYSGFTPLYLIPAKRKLATKSNSKKYFSIASVYLRYINEQESGGHQLKITDAKFAELNYCMFSILLV